MLERLRPLGYAGGITVLKELLVTLRPLFLAAKSYQRTSYLPGEISQLDWWHTGLQLPVGKDAEREAFGLVTTLPHSAAHATMFTFGRTTAEFCAAALGCFVRLGGVQEKVVTDNESCIVKPRRGGPARFVNEVHPGTLTGENAAWWSRANCSKLRAGRPRIDGTSSVT